MTDIVERLRDGCGIPRIAKMMDEAAAEIERLGALAAIVREQGIELTDLRAEIERLRGIEQFATETSRHERDGLRAEIERLKAQTVTDWIKHGDEIERLKAALQDIAEDPYAVDGGAAEIARRALEPKP